MKIQKYSSIQVFKNSSIQFQQNGNLLTNNVKARDPVGSKNINQFRYIASSKEFNALL